MAVRMGDSYLRVDVACGMEGCPVCPPTAPALPAGATHLLLPDAASLATYLEIFELLEGCLVLLTSVMHQVSRQLPLVVNMPMQEQLQRQVVDGLRRILGPEHPDTGQNHAAVSRDLPPVPAWWS